VRFRTTETGEFIELDDNNRKMILIFYIFIKILLRNIFLELIFNKADRKKVDLKTKLNIKMIVSVLYRAIIKDLSKKCVTKTNLDDIEEAEDMTAFLKLRFTKREFHLHRFLKKRYFLKVSQVEDKPKRISVRGKQPISPNTSGDEDEEERSIRETNKAKNEKKMKKIEKIEKENKNKESDDDDDDTQNGIGNGNINKSINKFLEKKIESESIKNKKLNNMNNQNNTNDNKNSDDDDDKNENGKKNLLKKIEEKTASEKNKTLAENKNKKRMMKMKKKKKT
jgi:hypothetical protein